MTGHRYTRRTTLGLFGAGAAAGLRASPAAGGHPRYHIAAPPGGWINDPQRPIRIGGVWTLWALYNPTYPHHGTAWRRWTSTDLVTWQDRGVSIPRQTTRYGDVWTGSTVVDKRDTAGFGAGTLIAIATMPARDAGGQNQSCALWYSHDGGASFAFHAIVLAGIPGHRAFRDPYLFWHAPTTRWMMTLSEEGRIGFYASDDLLHWRSVGGFASTAVGGIMECSQLFPLRVHAPDGTAIAETWVLMVGGNGTARGFTGGTWYWTGAFDGATFTPAPGSGRWLDHGPDFYATTVWSDPAPSVAPDIAYAIGWMNNWAYADHLGPIGDSRGRLSIVRQLRLVDDGGGPTLRVDPLPHQNRVFDRSFRGADRLLHDTERYRWPALPDATAFRLDLTLRRAGTVWPAEIDLALDGDAGRAVRFRFLPRQGVVLLRRETGGPNAGGRDAWVAERRIPYDAGEGIIPVSLFVDRGSAELFLGTGRASASVLLGSDVTASGIQLEALGGELAISKAVVHI